MQTWGSLIITGVPHEVPITSDPTSLVGSLTDEPENGLGRIIEQRCPESDGDRAEEDDYECHFFGFRGDESSENEPQHSEYYEQPDGRENEIHHGIATEGEERIRDAQEGGIEENNTTNHVGK